MFIAANRQQTYIMKVYSVNKVLYHLKFIQKTDIKKGVHSERPYSIF